MKYKGIARLRYDEKEDSMVLEVMENGAKEWGFCMSAKFIKHSDEDEEANFISYSIFKEWYRWCKIANYEMYWE